MYNELKQGLTTDPGKHSVIEHRMKYFSNSGIGPGPTRAKLKPPAMELPRCGNRGKTNCSFPTVSTALGKISTKRSRFPFSLELASAWMARIKWEMRNGKWKMTNDCLFDFQILNPSLQSAPFQTHVHLISHLDRFGIAQQSPFTVLRDRIAATQHPQRRQRVQRCGGKSQLLSTFLHSRRDRGQNTRCRDFITRTCTSSA